MQQEWVKHQEDLMKAFSVFESVATKLLPERRDQAGVCGTWTPKQVVAHLTGWDAEAARGFQAFVAGEAENFVQDVDAFNQQSVERRAHLSWEETLHDLYVTHALFQQSIDVLAVEHPVAAGYLSWLKGRIEDYQTHTGQLQAWL